VADEVVELMHLRDEFALALALLIQSSLKDRCITKPRLEQARNVACRSADSWQPNQETRGGRAKNRENVTRR
jgi:hypothetical protein